MKTKKPYQKFDNKTEQIVIGFIIIFLISLTLKDLLASIRLTLSYILFFYLPFIPLINSIKKIGLIEKFVLVNITGLSFGTIYVLLDVFLKIPMTKTLFIFSNSLILIYSWFIFNNKK